jgi:hypothetical protein
LGIGLVVLADMAVSDAHSNALLLSPPQHQPRKESYMAVHNIVLSLTQDFPEPPTKRPWIQASRARQHPAAERFYFACKESRPGTKRAEVEFEEVPVDIFQNVNKPSLDAPGIHRTDSV